MSYSQFEVGDKGAKRIAGRVPKDSTGIGELSGILEETRKTAATQRPSQHDSDHSQRSGQIFFLVEKPNG